MPLKSPQPSSRRDFGPGMLRSALPTRIRAVSDVAARFISLSELKIHPRDQLDHRTLLARAERLYQQFRGNEREWFGAQILAFERILESQDKRVIAPKRKEFETLLNEIEHQSYTNPGTDPAQ